jgi:hypothetical protein
MSAAKTRPICWPNPDEVCLQGGCIYCVEGPTKTEAQVRAYAATVNRMDAFDYGLRNGLYRASS